MMMDRCIISEDLIDSSVVLNHSILSELTVPAQESNQRHICTISIM